MNITNFISYLLFIFLEINVKFKRMNFGQLLKIPDTF